MLAQQLSVLEYGRADGVAEGVHHKSNKIRLTQRMQPNHCSVDVAVT